MFGRISSVDHLNRRLAFPGPGRIGATRRMAETGGLGPFCRRRECQITDGIFRESGWTFVAVTLMYTNNPGIPSARSPTPKRISETHVETRLFDIFPRGFPFQ